MIGDPTECGVSFAVFIHWWLMQADSLSRIVIDE